MTSYRLLDSYPAAPGKCISCGGVNTPVLDTAISLDYFGAIMFCLTCAKDLGRNAGLVDPSPPENPEDKLLKVTEEFKENVDSKLAGVIDILNGLSSYILSSTLDSGKPETGESEISSGESEQAIRQNGDDSLDKGSVSFSVSSGNELKFDGLS